MKMETTVTRNMMSTPSTTVGFSDMDAGGNAKNKRTADTIFTTIHVRFRFRTAGATPNTRMQRLRTMKYTSTSRNPLSRIRRPKTGKHQLNRCSRMSSGASGAFVFTQ